MQNGQALGNAGTMTTVLTGRSCRFRAASPSPTRTSACRDRHRRHGRHRRPAKRRRRQRLERTVTFARIPASAGDDPARGRGHRAATTTGGDQLTINGAIGQDTG